MRWWVILYLVIFIPFGLSALWGDLKKGQTARMGVSVWPFVAVVAGTFAYWLMAPAAGMAVVVGLLVIAAVPCLIIDGIRDSRELHAEDPNYGLAGEIITNTIVAILFLPGLIWGALYALRGLR